VNTDARERVLAAIADHGPISFAEFMELSLYGPGGFYDRSPVGPSGDFVTSPHVHPVFGALLARAIGELRDALGSPMPLRLVEVGAGDGTLAGQLLAALADPVAYTAVEISHGARAALAELDGVEVVDELPDEADVVLAHELLDNLPFRVVRGGREVAIAADGDRVREELVPIDEELGTALERVVAPREPPEEPPQGDLVVPVGAFAFVDRLASVLDRGYALLIDYGGLGTAGGPLHGYRDHRIVEDVLSDPGTSDITAGVDLAAIAHRATDAGLTAFASVTQREALLALGFERWAQEELARQHALLDRREGVEAVRAWSGRSRATLLVDPAALGRMRWLVLASAGLPQPSWLTTPGR
jgi:SAM-dependent MidA family methyltransferase